MFNKVLIANRGEIAVRVIRACQRMGIKTVAVYSDADRRSLHVRMADEAVHIGPAPARESYLNMDKVLSAATSTGCQAVHPGYGFLSENARFAQAVAAAGLTFIGPPAEAISLMGDKVASKETAIQAGVPVIPGYVGILNDENDAIEKANEIGYPVLLKPAAGGGGKGMRIVRNPDEMAEALRASRQETRKAFDEGGIFMERYIERPRHVEIQILADAHGNVVHLGERECSIQRRYQKVIEESPSPAMTPELRRRMGKAATDLARRTGYVNAGTVEFILDANGGFFFLEMNTRLQVEHPVTEKVTGLDLVEWQLRIASGERLAFNQEGVKFTGWAIEARICAEDPANGFLPATGMITRYAEPRIDDVRVDGCVTTGSHISMYYDSLLSKVITWGPTREAARLNLVNALNGYHVEGLLTNVDFVNAVLCHPAFIAGDLFTGFIEHHFDGERPREAPEPERLRLAALASTLIYHIRVVLVRRSLKLMASQIGATSAIRSRHTYMVRSEKDDFEVLLEGTLSGKTWTIHVNDRKYVVETPDFEFYRRRLKLVIDGEAHRFRLGIDQSFIFIAYKGICRTFEVYTPKEWALLPYMPERTERPPENVLICPMPGMVVDVRVSEGERVFKGQSLVIIESMKMESGVASPMNGIVGEVLVSAGQAVEAGDLLIRFQD